MSIAISAGRTTVHAAQREKAPCSSMCLATFVASSTSVRGTAACSPSFRWTAMRWWASALTSPSSCSRRRAGASPMTSASSSSSTISAAEPPLGGGFRVEAPFMRGQGSSGLGDGGQVLADPIGEGAALAFQQLVIDVPSHDPPMASERPILVEVDRDHAYLGPPRAHGQEAWRRRRGDRSDRDRRGGPVVPLGWRRSLRRPMSSSRMVHARTRTGRSPVSGPPRTSSSSSACWSAITSWSR